MSASEGLRLAVGTFTRYPSGRVTITPDTARAALLLAPLAVLPLALQVVVVGLTVEIGVPPLVAAGLALGVLAHGSRGMHLDGLADTVDGLGAGWDRERALEIMRRGDVGPMGAVALVIVLLVQVGAIAALLGAGWRGALVVGAAVVASRAAAAVCGRGQQAAPGSKLGAAFVGTVPFAGAVLVVLAVGALLVASVLPVALLLGGLGDGSSTAPSGSTARALLVAAAAVPAAIWAAISLRDRAASTFGGVGGDVIGAGVEVALTVLLVLLTVAW